MRLPLPIIVLVALISSCGPTAAEAILPVLNGMMSNATSYLSHHREQQYSAADGDEPWHLGVDDYSHERGIGKAVPWKQYTFPGGAESEVLWGRDGVPQGDHANAASALLQEYFVSHHIKPERQATKADFATWSITYRSAGAAEFARASVTARLRESPEKSVTCSASYRAELATSVADACTLVGFR